MRVTTGTSPNLVVIVEQLKLERHAVDIAERDLHDPAATVSAVLKLKPAGRRVRRFKICTALARFRIMARS